MSEAEIINGMISKTSSKIQALQNQLAIQEGILLELKSQWVEVTTLKKDKKETNGSSSDTTVGTEVIEILKNANAPMKLANIVAALAKNGRTEMPTQYLTTQAFGAIRRREDKIEKVGRGTYRLKT